MSPTSPISQNLGFLTVVDQPRLGLIGGYLVLNPAGRPLEFHCTTPVKPNRTQEILYGDSLEPYLYGERIAQTLISRSKIAVEFVLTNTASVLVVQDLVETPVLYVFDPRKDEQKAVESEEVTEESAEAKIEISEQLNESLKSFGIENSNLQTFSADGGESLRIPDVPGLDLQRWKRAHVGNRHVALPQNEEEQWNRGVEEIKRISLTIDLAEPFTRLRLAIDEAQRAA